MDQQSHHHDHQPGGHAHHAGMVHEPSAETLAEYSRAFANAQPVAGGRVVHVELEAGEIEWEFAPGQRTAAWGYNGQIPGPAIDARVGDVLEIELTNRLLEPTMIHWHGMRLPAPMDGTENVQHPVAPGGTFKYRFLLHDAGTFWYHPHMDETRQLERGLYGALIVRGNDEPQLDAERILVLDDVSLDSSGQIKPGGNWIEQHDGREGSTILVNGQSKSELHVRGGQIERWRIINAASARYVRFSIGGHSFHVLGTDGGLIERPFATTEILLAPADRIDIAVGPFNEGDLIEVAALEYGRGTIKQPRRETLGRIVVGARAPSKARLPNELREIQPLVAPDATPTRTIRLGYRPTLASPAFTINEESHHRAEPVRLGELQVWDIVNETDVDHPFHLHGFFFQLLLVNGNQPDFLSWEDTVNVAARGSVRLAWLPDERPGEWMYHCHILEHHAGGMMAHFEVVN